MKQILKNGLDWGLLGYLRCRGADNEGGRLALAESSLGKNPNIQRITANNKLNEQRAEITVDDLFAPHHQVASQRLFSL